MNEGKMDVTLPFRLNMACAHGPFMIDTCYTISSNHREDKAAYYQPAGSQDPGLQGYTVAFGLLPTPITS